MSDDARQQLKNLLRKTPKVSTAEGASFDPGEHTVAEVQEYIAANPDEEAKVLKAEAKGKNRATLTGG